MFNYQEICDDILLDLSPRVRQIIVRRFGLEDDQKETLQTIADDFGITRERVRQIQNVGFQRIKPRVERHEPIFKFFSNQLHLSGKLRKEDILLNILGPERPKSQLVFLLDLADEFDRRSGDHSVHSFWTVDQNSLEEAKKVIDQVYKEIKKAKKPLESEEIEKLIKISPVALFAFLEISKKIQKGPEGSWGLSEWSEIRPRGVRDKALIVFKRENKPLHFKEIAELIDQDPLLKGVRKTHPQTVHNELIKDSNFVLVGRGTYALKDWGYKPGVVKDIIVDILKKSKKSLSKEEIIEKVLEQRMVKKNTILLNLRNKDLFVQDSKGGYKLKA